MDETIRLKLTHERGYRFRADFDDPALAPLAVDEPPPLGAGSAPNPVRLLAVAVGDCLSASLAYCLQRAHVELEGMETEVEARLHRNEQGRLRVEGLTVRIHPEVDPAQQEKMKRCLGLFEDYCVVTQSVRAGIDVQVEIVADTPLSAGAPTD